MGLAALFLLAAGGLGCGGRSSHPPLPPAITAPDPATANQAGYRASVDFDPGVAYAWSGTGCTITAGVNAPTVTFTTGAPGQASLACTLTNRDGVATGSTSFTIQAGPVVTAPAQTVIRQGWAQATTQPVDGFTYSWSVQNGLVLDGGDTPQVTFLGWDPGAAARSVPPAS